MPTLRLDAVLRSALWGLLILLSLSACSPTYHFRYQYALIAPPGGTEGVENDQVRIQLSPTSESGIMQLAVVNKSPQAMAIVWDQTHYIDPFGRRRAASETGLQWFFRLREWFAEDTPIDPGDTFHTRVQAGERQEYNPFTLSRSASGDVTVSTATTPLLPTGGKARAVGQAYQGREFHFILALRLGTDVTLYPFTFRITDVAVQ
jgi:hypothetical protein